MLINMYYIFHWFRRLIDRPLDLFYRYIYLPLATKYYEMKDPEEWNRPLPPDYCLICGKSGHIERYCPKAKELGFLV
jgi:hypothetical protein